MNQIASHLAGREIPWKVIKRWKVFIEVRVGQGNHQEENENSLE